MAPQRRLALVAALLLACLACRLQRVAAYTLPDQLELITTFRDAMLARPGQQNWTKALASWTCPTNPSNSVGGSCDPCGQQAWGNWEHIACRGPAVTYTKERVPGDGFINHVHITDYQLEGEVPLKELCPFTRLTEFDLDGGQLVGTIPTGFADCFPEIQEIDLSYNSLSGTLPKEIAEMAQTLEQFKVEHNQLTGTLPADYGRMITANWLRFADNKLGGTIPASWAATSPHLSQLTLDENVPGFSGNLYMLAQHSMINFNAANNPQMCGMVPVGVRFAHGFNPLNTRLGLPCPDEVANGWQDLSETL